MDSFRLQGLNPWSTPPQVEGKMGLIFPRFRTFLDHDEFFGCGASQSFGSERFCSFSPKRSGRRSFRLLCRPFPGFRFTWSFSLIDRVNARVLKIAGPTLVSLTWEESFSIFRRNAFSSVETSPDLVDPCRIFGFSACLLS